MNLMYLSVEERGVGLVMLGLQQRKIGMDAQVEEPLEGTILPEEWEGAPHVEEIIHLHITEQDIQQHLGNLFFLLFI